MQSFPHRYVVAASGDSQGTTTVECDGLPTIPSAPPKEFGGRGDRWSPETLLVASVADCFVLTFRAIAEASRLPWSSLHCEVQGILDREDKVVRFTRFEIRAALRVADGVDVDTAQRLLGKAERNCLISNSLNATIHLTADVAVTLEPVGA